MAKAINIQNDVTKRFNIAGKDKGKPKSPVFSRLKGIPGFYLPKQALL